MRTTLNLQVQNSLSNIQDVSQKLSDSSTRVSTGKNILRASDDVSGTQQSLSLRSSISNISQLSDNTDIADSVLGITDSALGDIYDAILSVQSIAQKAASDTSSDASSYITQLDGIMSQLSDLANTQYSNQYIFSGTAIDQPAVTESSGTYTYTGNTGSRNVQILTSVSIPVNVSGSTVFNFDGSAGDGTTDVFTMITDLETAINSGDKTEISNQLTNINDNMNNVLTCRSKIGTLEQRVEQAQSILSNSSTNLEQLLSDTEDADMAQALVDFQTQMNVYQAATSVSSLVMKTSMASLDYIS